LVYKVLLKYIPFVSPRPKITAILFSANFVLLPLYTINLLTRSSGEGIGSPLVDNSLLILLILIHHRRRILVVESAINNYETSDENKNLMETPAFHDNPFYKALGNSKDIQCNGLSPNLDKL
jgi:dymeclin